MNLEFIKWAGLGLSFLTAFLSSLFYVSAGSFSKISVSRLLEDKDKPYRHKILENYDEIKFSIELLRSFFVLAFILYLFFIFPQVNNRPLLIFISALSIYFVLLDFLPRMINKIGKKKILALFLPSFRIPYIITKPLHIIIKDKTVEKEQEEQREASEDEIHAFVEEAKEEGIIEQEEEVLLKSVVEFGDTIVREIMTPRVGMASIRKKSTIKKLRDLVIKEKHSRIPVYKEKIDNIEGIIIAKDLLEYSDNKHKNSLIEPLIRPVYFVPESMKVSELLKEFQKRKQKLAIVVDEHGGTSGLVTMEDLMEEIVGEIQDEYDIDTAQFVEKGPFDFIVEGDAEVEELEERFKMNLEDENYITVSGLITHSLGRLPELNEKFAIKGLSFEILEVDQKRIKKIRITKTEG
jgi:CBS domain containing-hemolysin-like protein